jgi:YHS domain-containing protein
MNLIRRSAWAVIMLGAVVGCTGDDPSTAPSNPSAPNLPKAPENPVVPPATHAETPKADAAKDMPPPAKAGDSKKPDEPPTIEGPKTQGKGDTAAAKLTPDEIAAIRELPAAEQEQALKQAVCPVSGEHLGEMGKPYKTSAEGRTFYLCCDNCQKEVKSDPKAVIAKLDAKAGK